MTRAILATLQSIKDAGDDVVEPSTWEVCGEVWVDEKDYLTLLSAYKRVCVEKDQALRVFKTATDEVIRQAQRAEKAESERDEFRKALQSIAANTCCANCQEAALVARAAIDSARNK